MEIASFVFSLVAFGFSLYVFIDTVSQKKSTHQIQLIDPQTEYFNRLNGKEEAKTSPEFEFAEFDMPSETDLLAKEMKLKK
jgi:hypothetical protein